MHGVVLSSCLASTDPPSSLVHAQRCGVDAPWDGPVADLPIYIGSRAAVKEDRAGLRRSRSPHDLPLHRDYALRGREGDFRILFGDRVPGKRKEVARGRKVWEQGSY